MKLVIEWQEGRRGANNVMRYDGDVAGALSHGKSRVGMARHKWQDEGEWTDNTGNQNFAAFASCGGGSERGGADVTVYTAEQWASAMAGAFTEGEEIPAWESVDES